MPRSRLALAAAVTILALPVIVLDNLSATAETSDVGLEVAASATDERFSSERSTTSTAAPSSTTTAPETTTTEASTTTEAAVAQALRALAPTAPPTIAPPTTSPPATAPPGPGADSATWDRLALCESSGNWSISSGNGYYGGLQFSLTTWRNVGGAGYPHQATKAEQIKRGKILQAQAGWGQWPHCSRLLGYL